MKILKLYFMLMGALCLLGIQPLLAEDTEFVPGQLLIQLNHGKNISDIVDDFQRFQGKKIQMEVVREVSPPMNIWLLQFDAQAANHHVLKREVYHHPSVAIAQSNHTVTMRSTLPNDPNLGSQWHHVNSGSSGIADADIDSDEAWDITTGGTTTDNDDIVVAIIEGADLSHPDLSGNAWLNTDEIPGNSVDDDGNGYIDDYLGWNIVSQNDNVYSGSHGTQVAGMIGAKGNNGVGIAGANWDVKMMIVARGGLDEASVIEAYTYPLIMRRRYNDSDGAEGAFVVATNASWGIDNGDPATAPLWCAMYDTLGQEGILNCGATANNNVNIDVVGDLPTACPSDYMIAVTATNSSDQRTFSAYGLTTIDVGAPGSSVYTTSFGGGYGTTSGTSFASPLTAGVIGLMYSAPCPAFMSLVKSNPEAGAQAIRSALFAGVDVTGNLPGQTVTGGRINSFNSINILMSNFGCNGTQICSVPNGLNATGVAGGNATLNWSGSLSALSFTVQYRQVGSPTWISSTTSGTSLSVSGLMTCSTYEFQVMATCDSSSSAFSSSETFSTGGCGTCVDLPYCGSAGNNATEEWISNVSIGGINNTSGSDGGYGDYTTVSTTLDVGLTYPISLTPAYSGTNYGEYFIVWIDYNQDGDFDDAGELAFDAGATVTSTAGGNITIPATALAGSTRMRVTMKYAAAPTACEQFTFGEVEDYCVTINDNSVACAIPGNITTTNIDYSSATLQWTPVAGADHYEIRGGLAGSNPANYIYLTIPSGATGSFNVSNLSPSTSFEWQIITYCDAAETLASPWSALTTFSTNTCSAPVNTFTSNITSTSATLEWTQVQDATSYQIRGRVSGFGPFVTLSVSGGSTTAFNVSNLSPGTGYEWQVQAICSNGLSASAYTPLIPFITPLSAAQKAAALDYSDRQVNMYPNPAHSNLVIELKGFEDKEELFIFLYDLSGRKLQVHSTRGLASRLELDVSDLSDGLYHLVISGENYQRSNKLIIAR